METDLWNAHFQQVVVEQLLRIAGNWQKLQRFTIGVGRHHVADHRELCLCLSGARLHLQSVWRSRRESARDPNEQRTTADVPIDANRFSVDGHDGLVAKVAPHDCYPFTRRDLFVAAALIDLALGWQRHSAEIYQAFNRWRSRVALGLCDSHQLRCTAAERWECQQKEQELMERHGLGGTLTGREPVSQGISSRRRSIQASCSRPTQLALVRYPWPCGSWVSLWSSELARSGRWRKPTGNPSISTRN